MFKTPEFWAKKNLISYALLPFSLIYFLGFYLKKIFTKTTKISKPVICIGNIIAGGSGKTPTAIAIGKILHEMAVDFAFLSRGYMNDGTKFLMVQKCHDNNSHKVRQVGDEPILLSEVAPTFVAYNRCFGTGQIEKMARFQMIILDDGMQNNSLHHDFTILVIDGQIAFGNHFLIPAGPMRETLQSALKKTDLIVIIGAVKAKLLRNLPAKKIVRAEIIPVNLQKFSGKKLIAFCGLGYPQKFFSFLKSNGLQLIQTYDFADHHFYKNSELTKLCRIAQEKNAVLITTKKDWVKFPQIFQEKIAYLQIELEIANKEIVRDALKKIL
jgi:tetraacyldisaccharide 4'-kinase